MHFKTLSKRSSAAINDPVAAVYRTGKFLLTQCNSAIRNSNARSSLRSFSSNFRRLEMSRVHRVRRKKEKKNRKNRSGDRARAVIPAFSLKFFLVSFSTGKAISSKRKSTWTAYQRIDPVSKTIRRVITNAVRCN